MSRILGNDRVEILKLAAAKNTAEAIALAYPYSVHEIRRLVHFQSDPRARKVGPELAAEIRARVAGGESIAILSDELGLHRNTISRIVNGKAWVA